MDITSVSHRLVGDDGAQGRGVKTGNMERITTSSCEDRVTCTKIGEDRKCSSGDMIAGRQAHRQTDALITISRASLAGME